MTESSHPQVHTRRLDQVGVPSSRPDLKSPVALQIAKSRSPAPAVNAARAVLEQLAHRGVRAAFGIPGGLVSPFYDALVDVPAIEVITNRHEAMAGYAAMGHALVTGTPAIVLTTGGPGFTNVLTGIAAAFIEEVPLVVIAGDVSAEAAGRGTIHDISSNALDAMALVRTITRWGTRIDSPAAAIGVVEYALQVATGPRPGPVFLAIPLNVGTKPVNVPSMALPETPLPGLPNAAGCAELAAKLARARRPLLVVGNGARTAAAEVRVLAERLAIPVVTTPHAKGVFPDTHRLHLGGIGVGAHPSALAYFDSQPDVVLIIGSKLGDYATNGWSIPIAGSEATVQIDREPWLIGRNYPVTLGIVADARAALQAVLAALPGEFACPIRESGAIARIDSDKASSDEVPLHPARVLSALGDAFSDAFWTVDHGEHCAYALHYLTINEPDRFRTMVGIAAMGTGIGTAIGARQARRDRPVIAICGDGCFAMHAGEVLSCVEHGIDVILAVFNDGRYNMVHHGLEAIFGRISEALPRQVADIASVAEAFGAVGVCVRTPEDLDVDYLRSLANTGRPVVLDIRIDPRLSLAASGRAASLRRSANGSSP